MARDDEQPGPEALIERAEDVRRVDLLYRDHGPALRRRLRAQVQSSEEASDLLHDAFARLLASRPLGRLLRPEAFLNRIVRNLLIDRSRRLATRAVHVGIDEAPCLSLPAHQADELEERQMRQLYRDAVAALPARMREVFLLHRVERLSYKEIAGRLGISVRTVEWHIAEAIVRIGKGLDGE